MTKFDAFCSPLLDLVVCPCPMFVIVLKKLKKIASNIFDESFERVVFIKLKKKYFPTFLFNFFFFEKFDIPELFINNCTINLHWKLFILNSFLEEIFDLTSECSKLISNVELSNY